MLKASQETYHYNIAYRLRPRDCFEVRHSMIIGVWVNLTVDRLGRSLLGTSHGVAYHPVLQEIDLLPHHIITAICSFYHLLQLQYVVPYSPSLNPRYKRKDSLSLLILVCHSTYPLPHFIITSHAQSISIPLSSNEHSSKSKYQQLKYLKGTRI